MVTLGHKRYTVALLRPDHTGLWILVHRGPKGVTRLHNRSRMGLDGMCPTAALLHKAPRTVLLHLNPPTAAAQKRQATALHKKGLGPAAARN